MFYLCSSDVTFLLECLLAAVSVLVGLCCPAPLSCMDVGVHTVVLLGKIKLR